MAPRAIFEYNVEITFNPFPKMTSAPTILNWRPFENVPSGPEAASVAASCAFSMATLEVASLHDASGFALTERRQPEVWRWAVIGKDGTILEEGCEHTQAEAKRSAEEALNLADDEGTERSTDPVPSLEAATACRRTLPATG
jgi:hypothetical protein